MIKFRFEFSLHPFFSSFVPPVSSSFLVLVGCCPTIAVVVATTEQRFMFPAMLTLPPLRFTSL